MCDYWNSDDLESFDPRGDDAVPPTDIADIKAALHKALDDYRSNLLDDAISDYRDGALDALNMFDDMVADL